MILRSAAMNQFQLEWLLVFFFEALLYFWMFEPLTGFLKKHSIRKGLWAFAWTGIYLTAKWQLEGYIFLNIIAMLILGTVGLLMFSDRKVRTSLWLAAVFTICVELGRILVYGPIFLTGNRQFYLSHIWILRVLAHLLKSLFALFCRKTICEYSRYRIYGINWALVVLAIVQLVFMHYRRIYSAENAANVRIEIETFFILGGGVLSLLAIVRYNIQSFLQKKQMDEIRRAMDTNYQNIQMKSEVDNEIRRIYHDLKQQLAAIDMPEEKLTQKEKGILTERLTQAVSDLEMISETGSSLLDSLLNHKWMEAKNKQIRMEIIAETVGYDFIDPMDLCSIVGNAIDNACEAATQIEQEEKRWIQVKIAVLQGFWVFKVENTCKTAPIVENKRFISTKPGPKREGIGIRSIQYCADKYQGKVDLQAIDGRFVLRVVIPVLT